MITQLAPSFSTVATSVRPEDLFLQKGSWVRFTDEWPDTHKWCKGKVFEVAQEPIIVQYPLTYIIPGDDYKDVDISNATAGEKLYPETEGILYQIAVGLKPGDYLVHLYVPKDKYIYNLGEASMFPNIDDAKKKYLGAKTPSETPHTAPLLFLYAIKDMPAFTLRFYALEGVDYEKCTAIMFINKCQLKLVEEPTEEQLALALLLRWHTEFLGI